MSKLLSDIKLEDGTILKEVVIFEMVDVKSKKTGCCKIEREMKTYYDVFILSNGSLNKVRILSKEEYDSHTLLKVIDKENGEDLTSQYWKAPTQN